MNKQEKQNRNYLKEMGIDNFDLQNAAIKKIPCGELLVRDAMEDMTDLNVNTPRALMVCEYKGVVIGLIQAQNILDKIVS